MYTLALTLTLDPTKRNNQPLYMYGETPFVSYTVCVNHVVEEVVSSAFYLALHL